MRGHGCSGSGFTESSSDILRLFSSVGAGESGCYEYAEKAMFSMRLSLVDEPQ